MQIAGESACSAELIWTEQHSNAAIDSIKRIDTYCVGWGRGYYFFSAASFLEISSTILGRNSASRLSTMLASVWEFTPAEVACAEASTGLLSAPAATASALAAIAGAESSVGSAVLSSTFCFFGPG